MSEVAAWFNKQQEEDAQLFSVSIAVFATLFMVVAVVVALVIVIALPPSSRRATAPHRSHRRRYALEVFLVIMLTAVELTSQSISVIMEPAGPRFDAALLSLAGPFLINASVTIKFFLSQADSMRDWASKHCIVCFVMVILCVLHISNLQHINKFCEADTPPGQEKQKLASVLPGAVVGELGGEGATLPKAAEAAEPAASSAAAVAAAAPSPAAVPAAAPPAAAEPAAAPPAPAPGKKQDTEECLMCKSKAKPNDSVVLVQRSNVAGAFYSELPKVLITLWLLGLFPGLDRDHFNRMLDKPAILGTRAVAILSSLGIMLSAGVSFISGLCGWCHLCLGRLRSKPRREAVNSLVSHIPLEIEPHSDRIVLRWSDNIKQSEGQHFVCMLTHLDDGPRQGLEVLQVMEWTSTDGHFECTFHGLYPDGNFDIELTTMRDRFTTCPTQKHRVGPLPQPDAEMPVEVIREVIIEMPGPQRVVEVIKEVPGPEKVVQVIKEVPGPERVVEVIKEMIVEKPVVLKEQDAHQRANQALLDAGLAQKLIDNFSFCVTLTWHENVDLDLRLHTPSGTVDFDHQSVGAFSLDLDDRGETEGRKVENISASSELPCGKYTIFVFQQPAPWECILYIKGKGPEGTDIVRKFSGSALNPDVASFEITSDRVIFLGETAASQQDAGAQTDALAEPQVLKAEPLEDAFDFSDNAAAEQDGSGIVLTEAKQNQRGTITSKESFESGENINVQFIYDMEGGNGADGICVALLDADDPNHTQVGSYGGGLGFDCRPGAALGVGFDSFGTFGQGCKGIIVKGGHWNNFKILEKRSQEQTGVVIQGKDKSVHMVFRLHEDEWSVTLEFCGQMVFEDFRIPGLKLPKNIKVGFSAATGGCTNRHILKSFKLSKSTLTARAEPNKDQVATPAPATLAATAAGQLARVVPMAMADNLSGQVATAAPATLAAAAAAGQIASVVPGAMALAGLVNDEDAPVLE